MKRLYECAAHDEQVSTQDKKVKFEIFFTLLDTDLISLKEGRFDKLIKTWKLGGLCNFCETPKNKSWLNAVQISVWLYPLFRVQILKELLH